LLGQTKCFELQKWQHSYLVTIASTVVEQQKWLRVYVYMMSSRQSIYSSISSTLLVHDLVLIPHELCHSFLRVKPLTSKVDEAFLISLNDKFFWLKISLPLVNN
jgi:hypothetical protein